MKLRNYFLSFLLAGMCFSCDETSTSTEELEQLQEENANLRKQLEEGKTIVNIRFEEYKMVLVYSDGSEIEVSMPDTLKGKDGINVSGMTFDEETNALNVTLSDGSTFSVTIPKPADNGIKEMTYDSATGNLTVTLNNGESSTFFLFVDKEVQLQAVLLEDLSGKAFVEAFRLGDVPLVTVEYDDQFRVTKLIRKEPYNGKIVTTQEIEKTYSGDKVGVSTKKYALKDEVYNEYLEWYDDRSEVILSKEDVLDEENAQFRHRFYEKEEDGSFTYYLYAYQLSKNEFEYERISNIYGIERESENASFKYEISVPVEGEENTFILYRELEDNEEIIYYQRTKKVKLSFVKSGELQSEGFQELVYDAQNRVAEIIEKDGEQIVKRTVNTYNAQDMLSKVETYKWNGSELVKNAGYVELAYEENKHMKSFLKEEGKADKEVFSAIYDLKGNPIEIWKWFDAEYAYSYSVNPETGLDGYQSKLIREEGFYKAFEMEYHYNYKNFLGHSFSSLFPELEGLKMYNALKRVNVPNAYDYAGLEYSDFDEKGYPETMTGFVYEATEAYQKAIELRLNYTFKED